MVPISINTDFTFYLPFEFSGQDFGENATLSVSLFTINTDNTFDFSVTANPCPISIDLDGSNLRYMQSGVLQAILKLNIPDPDFVDGYLNRTKVISTDLYFKKPPETQQNSSYYTKSEVRQIIEELEATIASQYIDSIELSDYVGQETYSKAYIDSSLNRRAELAGDYNQNFQVKELQMSPYVIRYNTDENKLEIKHSGGSWKSYIPIGDSGTLVLDSSLVSSYYNKSQVNSSLAQKADLSYVNSSLALKANLSYVDSSFYNKSQIDQLLENVPSSSTSIATNLQTLTQTEYDNLQTYDQDTYYFIIETT